MSSKSINTNSSTQDGDNDLQMETNEDNTGIGKDYDHLVDSLLVLGQPMVKYGFIKNIPTRTDVVSDSYFLNVNRFVYSSRGDRDNSMYKILLINNSVLKKARQDFIR